MASLIAGRLAKLSEAEFFAAVEAGVFGDRRVFLWGGRLCEKMAKTKPHVFVEGALSDALRARVPAPWIVRGENPIRLGGRYVPLPDIVVLRGPWRRFADRRPTPEDVGLLVEIAVSSLKQDLGAQAAEYARAGIPRYWVIDVANRVVIEHLRPEPEGVFGSVVRYGIGEEIPLILDGMAVGQFPVSEMF